MTAWQPWGADRYGDPCWECGFRWSSPVEPLLDSVATAPIRYGRLLSDAHGDERHDQLDWTVGEYVCHVADNLHIWAERVVGASEDGESDIAGYDQDELAVARTYAQIPLPAALWSLGRSVQGWVEAMRTGLASGVVLTTGGHGDTLRIADVVRATAHDVIHHEWDLVRTMAAAADRS